MKVLGVEMFTALILICAVDVASKPEDCTRNNAATVMRAPTEFGNPATCFMQGQAYLAANPIGRQLDASDRVKVICVRSEIIARAPSNR